MGKGVNNWRKLAYSIHQAASYSGVGTWYKNHLFFFLKNIFKKVDFFLFFYFKLIFLCFQIVFIFKIITTLFLNSL